MMYKGIVIGHSFVRGLNDHFTHQNGGIPLTPSEVAESLSVSDMAEVTLAGVSGARVLDPNYELPHDMLSAIN